MVIGIRIDLVDAVEIRESRVRPALQVRRQDDNQPTTTAGVPSGAPARGERIAKYNRLLTVAHQNPTLPFGQPTRTHPGAHATRTAAP